MVGRFINLMRIAFPTIRDRSSAIEEPVNRQWPLALLTTACLVGNLAVGVPIAAAWGYIDLPGINVEPTRVTATGWDAYIAVDPPGKGEVGGPPSIPLGPPDEGKQRTPAVVIGRGKSIGRPVELVAYGWLAPRDSAPPSDRDQFCVSIEYLPDEVSPGTCNAALDPSLGRAIVIDDLIRGLGTPAQRITEIGGRLSPDVASVQVLFRRSDLGATASTP